MEKVHVSYAHEEAAGAASLSTGTVSAVCLHHFRQLQPHEPVAPSFFTGSAAPLRALLLARTFKHAVFGLSFHFSRVICSRTKKVKRKKVVCRPERVVSLDDIQPILQANRCPSKSDFFFVPRPCLRIFSQKRSWSARPAPQLAVRSAVCSPL